MPRTFQQAARAAFCVILFFAATSATGFASVDDAQSFALQAAEPYVKEGFQVREDYWGGDLGSGEKKDRKSTRLNSSHANISYAVFCLKKKKKPHLALQNSSYSTIIY